MIFLPNPGLSPWFRRRFPACMTLPKIKGLRWWMMALLMLGSIINYLTRSTLSVSAPTLKHDLQITDQQYSYIANAFQGTLMLQPFCGYVLDSLGLKMGFAIFAIARMSWAGRRLRQPGGDEGHVGMVSRPGTRSGRRPVQHRRLGRFDAGPAAGGLGHYPLQLAGRLCRDRRAGIGLGFALAGLLQLT
jgi:MFS family permease